MGLFRSFSFNGRDLVHPVQLALSWPVHFPSVRLCEILHNSYLLHDGCSNFGLSLPFFPRNGTRPRPGGSWRLRMPRSMAWFQALSHEIGSTPVMEGSDGQNPNVLSTRILFFFFLYFLFSQPSDSFGLSHTFHTLLLSHPPSLDKKGSGAPRWPPVAAVLVKRRDKKE